ncbi:MAG TPA: hypothetical protein VMF05_11170 [Stellaceae bacterium]|nr:hypothetical protein [Stellaceae bacterium]
MADGTYSDAGFGGAGFGGAGFDGSRPGVERARAILAELACATRETALSVADERKAQFARQVDGVATAVRAAARSLDGSEIHLVARYADRAAAQIEDLAHRVGERHWSELAGDLDRIARRQPAWFVAGAVALGFVAGRFFSPSAATGSAPQAERPERGPPLRELP